MADCPNNVEKKTLGCIDKEYVLVFVSMIVGLFTFLTLAVFAATAKADRVIAIEEKVDYIYKYIIESKK